MHNNFKVEKQWDILKGTVGLDCHKSPRNIKTLYDNIKVTLLVATAPNVTLGKLEAFLPIKGAFLGQKELPADSCKQIHDASLLNNKPRSKNGVYWIKTDLQGSDTLLPPKCLSVFDRDYSVHYRSQEGIDGLTSFNFFLIGMVSLIVCKLTKCQQWCRQHLANSDKKGH